MSSLGPTKSPTQWVPEFFPWDKADGGEVNHSPPSITVVSNEWNSISVTPLCAHAVERDNSFPFHSETNTESFGFVVTL